MFKCESTIICSSRVLQARMQQEPNRLSAALIILPTIVLNHRNANTNHQAPCGSCSAPDIIIPPPKDPSIRPSLAKTVSSTYTCSPCTPPTALPPGESGLRPSSSSSSSSSSLSDSCSNLRLRKSAVLGEGVCGCGSGWMFKDLAIPFNAEAR